MKLPHLFRNNTGDTIVEVLIAMAVVSAVLVGAFMVTSKSVSGVRTGQEQGEMLQVLQSQVERVRELAIKQTEDTGGIFAPGNFCINDSNPATPVRVSASNSVCNNIQGRYNVSVQYVNKVFVLKGTWIGPDGNQITQRLSYRVYPGIPITGGDVAAAPAAPPQDLEGDAFFSNGSNGAPTCGVSLGLPPCNKINPNGYYEYNFSVVNQSDNDVSRILGCVWNWGDGTVLTYGPNAPECRYGTRVYHTYPVVDPEQPYPKSCNMTTYKPTLTMKVSGVAKDPTYTAYAALPYCGVAKKN